MTLTFGSPSEYGYRQSFYFVLLFLPVLAGTTYLMLYYLVPNYLLKRRFFLFGLYTGYAVILAAWLEMMIAMGLFVLVYRYQMDQLNPKIADLGYQAGIMALVILPALAIQVTRQWYNERQVTDRLRQEKLQLQLYAREKELDYLKEQMHPHFLFNVLNSLYGLTLEKSDQAPELVLKVSGMLDYMLYRSTDDFVPLADEIEHIKNYIEIQKLRFEERLTLKIKINPDIVFYRIAPMILLPFIENSFKHGVSVSPTDSFIDISAKVKENVLHFTVINSMVANTDHNKPGVGLRNVKKRLSLLYEDKYSLKTRKTGNSFSVDLLIPVKRIPDGKVEMHDR